MNLNSLPPKGRGRALRADVHLRLPVKLRDDLVRGAVDSNLSLNTYITSALILFTELLRYEDHPVFADHTTYLDYLTNEDPS